MDEHVGTFAAPQRTLRAATMASAHRDDQQVNGETNPDVDIRIVLFTVVAGELRFALVDNEEGRRLPRGRPTPGEALDAEARRIARGTTGLKEQYLEQLYTFSHAPPRWKLIVAYLALLCSEGQPRGLSVRPWYGLTSVEEVSGADRQVIEYAIVRLRAKLSYTAIAFHLMPPTFTLSELQVTYEAILGQSLDKRNFRRRVLAAGFLDPTGAKRREGSHRPALLYRFRSTRDRDEYLTPSWAEGE